MKRVLAALVLLMALSLLVKLAGKGEPAPGASDAGQGGEVAVVGEESTNEAGSLLARHPADREFVADVYDRYRLTAIEAERAAGLRGLRLLDRLDLEAIFLLERHPDEFRRLASALEDDASADLLGRWSGYFGLKRADASDRERLVASIARLAPSRRRLAARYPEALPLILAEPEGVSDLIRRLGDEPERLADALAMLDFIALDRGSGDLRRALQTLEQDPDLALDAFRQFGPEGFALVTLYGPTLRALGDALPLDQALIVLKVNTDDVDDLLRTKGPEAVARHLRHVAAAGLVEEVGGSPRGLRLSVEFGETGDRALTQAGADAADVVYNDFDDPLLRSQAVRALGSHGPMAAAMLAKYALDEDFRVVLARHGADAIPPIAQADVAPEVLRMLREKPKRTWTESLAKQILAHSGDSGQATIRLIRKDGLARAEEVGAADLQFYHFLPLYDLIHLAGVMGRGHSPTRGEMTWALVDGCLVVVDALSLTAMQPAAAAATEAARAELKATARTAARTAGRELVEEAAGAVGPAAAKRGAGAGASTAAEHAARWWTVRAAGGTYQVLRRLPEALPTLSLARLTEMARPVCQKAGLRLAAWRPLRFVQGGKPVVLGIPADRWGKYVGVNLAQAGVGIVAMHKMEEYLSSERGTEAVD